jgi:hypothetical protein
MSSTFMAEVEIASHGRLKPIFSKFQTCIQINKNTKVKKTHFILIIQNNKNNRKHIKIKKMKVKKKN